MARDQELVKQLQRRLRDWDPEGQCKLHDNAERILSNGPFLIESLPYPERCCEYDEQGRLITLHLCQLGLTQIPSEVWQILSLQELSLSNNQLSTLPAEVGNLTSLQRLTLDRNQLSTLPAEVGNLTSLQRL